MDSPRKEALHPQSASLIVVKMYGPPAPLITGATRVSLLLLLQFVLRMQPGGYGAANYML